MPVNDISIVTQTISASMVKFWSVVIKISLSKCTCSKNLNLLQHLKPLAHNTQGCWLHKYYTMHQSCKFGEFMTRNNLDIINRAYPFQKLAANTLISSSIRNPRLWFIIWDRGVYHNHHMHYPCKFGVVRNSSNLDKGTCPQNSFNQL